MLPKISPFIAGVALISVSFSLGPISGAAMRESPTEANDTRKRKYGNRARSLLSQNDKITLQKKGIVIVDNVLTSTELEAARADIKRMKELGHFVVTEQDDLKVRTDMVHWINQPITEANHDSCNSDIKLFDGLYYALSLVRSVPSELLIVDTEIAGNQSRFRDSNMGVPFSNQLSCQSQQGFRYAPHRDKGDETGWFQKQLQFFVQPGLQEREVTIVLYLNQRDWSDGRKSNDSYNDGCLRCYIGTDPCDDTGESADSIIDISPDGGRLVIFDSKTLLHEVINTDRERSALTCWVGGSHSTYKNLRPYCVQRTK